MPSFPSNCRSIPITMVPCNESFFLQTMFSKLTCTSSYQLPIKMISVMRHSNGKQNSQTKAIYTWYVCNVWLVLLTPATAVASEHLMFLTDVSTVTWRHRRLQSPNSNGFEDTSTSYHFKDCCILHASIRFSHPRLQLHLIIAGKQWQPHRINDGIIWISTHDSSRHRRFINLGISWSKHPSYSEHWLYVIQNK